MKKTLYIIASCTDKKRIQAPRDLRLHSIKKSGVARATEWKDRLRSAQSELLRAVDMYIGPHWATALSLPEIAHINGYNAELWVASAGYGLIPATVKIKPYSATFTARHADSVVGMGTKSEILEGCTDWWRQMSRWKGPKGGNPRTIGELVGNNHNAMVMVVASPSYLNALYVDLKSAKAHMNDTNRLILVSAGSNQLSELTPNLLPVSAKLQHTVGGSRIGLNARIARKVLEESGRWQLDAEVLRRRYSTLSARLPEVMRYERETMTDADVVRFIYTVIRANPDESATSTLRKLRDNGNACEQKRFGRIFKQVKKVSYG